MGHDYVENVNIANAVYSYYPTGLKRACIYVSLYGVHKRNQAYPPHWEFLGQMDHKKSLSTWWRLSVTEKAAMLPVFLMKLRTGGSEKAPPVLAPSFWSSRMIIRVHFSADWKLPGKFQSCIHKWKNSNPLEGRGTVGGLHQTPPSISVALGVAT